MQKIAAALLLISAFLSLHLFLFLRNKNSQSRSLFYLSLFLAFSAWWSFWNAYEYLVPSFQMKLFFANLQYLSIPTVAVLWYAFGRSFDREERFGSGHDPHWLVWIVPAITAVLVWFDPLLGLVRFDLRLDSQNGVSYIAKSFGPWFWFMWIHSYLFVILGIVYVLRGIIAQDRTNRFRVVFLIVGVLFPTVANFAYVVFFSSRSGIDPTPIVFTFTGVFLIVNLARFRFLPFIGSGREQAMEELQDAVLLFDRDFALMYANPSAVRFLGLRPEHIGKHIDEVSPVLSRLHDLRVGEERGITLDDGRRSFEVRASSISKKGKKSGLALTLYDVSRRVVAEEGLKTANHELERKIAERTRALEESNGRLTEELEHRIRTERQLTHTALHDPLTGLPNRNLLMSRLEQSIARFHRDQEAQYGVLFLDIDDFKQINDTFGHNAGDAFLCEIASRLRRCVREVDTVARLGGDEFVVLLDGVGIALDVGAAADRIGDELSIPFYIGQNSVIPTASIGVLVGRIEISNAGDALRDADIAMYRAKHEGKNKRVSYDDKMLERVLEENRLTRDLRTAVGGGDIRLAFQPISRIADGSVVGWEVLARWKHPEFGMIGPDRFIPIAEQTGLIVPLGTFIILETLKTAAQLRAAELLSEGRERSFFAVNVSAVQLASPDFVDFVLSSIDRFALPRSMLHIELTESALIQNREAAVTMMERLSAEGISFKLDDFGTGYSSLGYLDRLPADTVKIDRSFIERIEAEDGLAVGGGLVRGIISLSHELGKSVVAEGIETPAQAEALLRYGCDYGQGYLYGKPVDADALAVSLMREPFAVRNDRL